MLLLILKQQFLLFILRTLHFELCALKLALYQPPLIPLLLNLSLPSQPHLIPLPLDRIPLPPQITHLPQQLRRPPLVLLQLPSQLPHQLPVFLVVCPGLQSLVFKLVLVQLLPVLLPEVAQLLLPLVTLGI